METCSCTNCYNTITAKGLCDTHYRRMKRHGSTEQSRPVDWGMKEKHPLYHSWGWIKKMRGRHQIETSWEDFWVFVADIGERPSPTHRLTKQDESLGYTKDNLFWKPMLASSSDKSAYARDWRKANPDKAKNSDLKARFGISLEEYKTMKESQNNSCAICDKHEDDMSMSLAVDHNHDTGKVRGLLCSACNTSLGGFQDKEEVLQRAVSYLRSHTV